MVPTVLAELHDSPAAGHLGVGKVLEMVRRRFYWVGQRNPVSQGTRSPTNFRSGGPNSLGNSVPLGPKFLGNWVLREYCTSRDLGPGGGGGGGGPSSLNIVRVSLHAKMYGYLIN